MKYKKEFMNMTEIGRLFGATGHQVGKWLKQLDLRTDCGNPSKEAYNHKLISAGLAVETPS